MATPLYKFLKNSGYSTYVFPSASEDISLAYQNDNYKMNFSKFALLKFDLSKMNLDNLDEFNTESTKVITDKGELIVNHLRNYIANHEVVIREALLNNNNNFYNPNEIRTTTEKIFWKWLRKTGAIQFEPAIPNDEYIDIQDFAVDDNLPDDYFKEYLWKERSVISYSIGNIQQETFDNSIIDPNDNIGKNIFKVTLTTSSNIKPFDRIMMTSEGNINIGFKGDLPFTVLRVETDDFGGTVEDKNNIIYILSDIQLIWNNFAVASLKLIYERVLKYLGEVSSVNNVQDKDKSYTEITAFIPDQNGETPDVLFRLYTDKNYSPSLQYPILPSQDQPEIVGGEQFDSPINLKPSDFPGDQYAYFDVDQKYLNANGLQDRKTGDYFGVFESSRNAERVVEAPFVYPEFDGKKLDGVTVDFDPSHYVKMNLPTKKSTDFDMFNAQTFNNLPPKDFEFNVVLWYYQVEDKTKINETEETSTVVTDTPISTTSTTTNVVTRQVNKVNQDEHIGINLYGITILNPVNPDTQNIEPYKKLVANGKQDGLSYIFNLNLNFNISSENVIEAFDPNKVYSQFGFDLYNNIMRKISFTNDVYMSVSTDIVNLRKDVDNVKTLIYTQTDIRDVNSRIDSLYTLLNTYKRNQISDSDSIHVNLDESTNPPTLKLISTDARYAESVKYSVSLLYNNQSNTVLNNRITVPQGKDFLINIINDDNSDITLDNNLNIILDRDLAFKQTCEIKIYPNSAKFNKKLNVSINSSLVKNIDTVRGYQLLSNIELPIDKNLNPNIEIEGLSKRWRSFPEIFPTSIGMKKIADSYYLVLGIDSLKINSFKTGDVIFLENFELVKVDDIEVPIVSDISGQYVIVGDIENNEITFEIKNRDFKKLFDELRKKDTSPTIYLKDINITQPSFIRYNTGWFISITANDRVAQNIADKYLIEIRPLKKEDL
jgi:hypothetical protein